MKMYFIKHMYSQLVLARSTLGMDSYPESLICVSGIFCLSLSASVALESTASHRLKGSCGQYCSMYGLFQSIDSMPHKWYVVFLLHFIGLRVS